MKITDWAEEDRPREKLMAKGVDALTDAELFAILIGSGNNDETAVSLMQRLLKDCDNDLNKLAKLELRDFMKYNGLGPAKSISIIAALEIGKRRKLQERSHREFIRNAQDVFDMFQPVMCDLPVEHFYVVCLSPNRKIICKERLTTGGPARTLVDFTELFRIAVINRASSILIVHNHPGGNANPSEIDINTTLRINDLCNIMKIALYDHIIITEDDYYSFRTNKKI